MSSHTIYLQTISPVHIGDSGDKHLVKNLDYVFDQGKLYVPTMAQLEQAFGDPLADIIINGKLRQRILDNKNRFASMALSQEPGGEIRKHVTRGWDQALYVPGSSIKGSIITALCHAFGGQQKIGQFAGSLGSFIRVSDTGSFETQPQLANTKTFYINLNNNNRAGWREGRGRSIDTLNPNTQVVTYECLPAGAQSQFSVQFPESKLEYNGNSEGLKAFKEKGNETITTLLTAVHTFNVEHLTREIAFFNHFDHNDTRELAIWLEQLLEKAQQGGKYLFRLGNGCGMHHLTAELTHSDHTDLHGIHRKMQNGRTFGKTRKLVFSFDAQRKLHISVMGYCWLSLNPLPQQEITSHKPQITAATEPQEVVPTKLPAAQFKDGKVVFAVAKDFKDGKLFVELMVEGLEHQVFPLSYASGAEIVGKNLEVEVLFIIRKDPKKGFNLKMKKVL
jgi:hypothetical protein